MQLLDTGVPRASGMEKFCGESFFGLISASYNRFIFPSLLLSLTIGMAYCTTLLGPTTQAESFLPESHPLQRFIDISAEEFAISADSDMKKVNLVFGLNPEQPMDRSAYSKYEIDMGPLVFYDLDQCDFSSPVCILLLTFAIAFFATICEVYDINCAVKLPIQNYCCQC